MAALQALRLNPFALTESRVHGPPEARDPKAQDSLQIETLLVGLIFSRQRETFRAADVL
jgi:hypothetical protein